MFKTDTKSLERRLILLSEIVLIDLLDFCQFQMILLQVTMLNNWLNKGSNMFRCLMLSKGWIWVSLGFFLIVKIWLWWTKNCLKHLKSLVNKVEKESVKRYLKRRMWKIRVLNSKTILNRIFAILFRRQFFVCWPRLLRELFLILTPMRFWLLEELGVMRDFSK